MRARPSFADFGRPVTRKSWPDTKLRRSFDAAAADFDSVASLPREIANRMIERLSLVRLPVRTILDAGCGTGHGARLLKQRYPGALVVELDLSEQMLRQPETRSILRWPWFGPSRRRRAVCADFQQLPLDTASIDLIWSNLALHWAQDMAGVLAEAHRILRPGGLLMFSVFGPDTLEELRNASQGGTFHVNVHADMHDVGDMLVNGGYADPVMDMENVTLTYADVHNLLRDLRAHGSISLTGDQRKGLGGRRDYLRVISRYEQFRLDDGRLPANYEVVYGHAWKPEPRVSPTGRPVFDIRSV